MQAIHIAIDSFPILIAILHVGSVAEFESLYTLKKDFIFARKIYTISIAILLLYKNTGILNICEHPL